VATIFVRRTDRTLRKRPPREPLCPARRWTLALIFGSYPRERDWPSLSIVTARGQRVSRDQVIWSFGPTLDPVLEVEPGAVVTFETNDCFSGQIRSESDLVTEIDLNKINSATGPVAVRGAMPGDSLVAEILDVRPVTWGVAALIPGFGPLIEQARAPLTRVFEVSNGEVRMNERVSFPARPMVGVVGVATDGETLSNGFAGPHGGNLDDHLHGPGARILFPVRQPGAMFGVGDMHAAMGDGEICFTGVEIAGEVDIRFDLLKGRQATWPVTELRDRWVPHATADTYEEALALCAEEASKLLVDEWGFTIEDAFVFLSVACDAGVAQACKPAPGGFGTIARFEIPKLSATPGPFRSDRPRPS
jgi:amidase